MDALSPSRWRAGLRRTVFFALTFLTAGGATALMVDALQANNRLTGFEFAGIVLNDFSAEHHHFTPFEPSSVAAASGATESHAPAGTRSQ